MRFTTSKPPTSILWFATFDEELWVTWPNIALFQKTDPRFVRNWEAKNPTSPLQCSFFNIWPSSWLGQECTLCNGSGYPEESLLQGAFSLEKYYGADGRITCKFTITSERKAFITWENTRKVKPRNAAGFLRGAISVEKTKILGAVGRITYKVAVTVSTRHVLYTWENTRNVEGSLQRAFPLKKDTESGSSRPRVIKNYNHIECKTPFTWDHTRILGGLVRRNFSL